MSGALGGFRRAWQRPAARAALERWRACSRWIGVDGAECARLLRSGVCGRMPAPTPCWHPVLASCAPRTPISCCTRATSIARRLCNGMNSSLQAWHGGCEVLVHLVALHGATLQPAPQSMVDGRAPCKTNVMPRSDASMAPSMPRTVHPHRLEAASSACLLPHPILHADIV